MDNNVVDCEGWGKGGMKGESGNVKKKNNKK